MSTAVVSFSSVLNPLLKGKEIKEGVHTISVGALEVLKIGISGFIKNPKGERLVTSPVEYWEIVEEEGYGVIVTQNSIYKVLVIKS